MRVIAGIYKGRRLISPTGSGIRPTSDKVKGAIFNMLGESVVDATVVDLFAGTGALGVEALSRGAKKCWFCDLSADSAALLQRNLTALGIGGEGVTLRDDFRRALRVIAGASAKPASGGVDLVFVDPPYDKGYYGEVMRALLIHDMISPGGLVVLESAADARVAGNGRAFPGFGGIKSKRYGHTAVDIYERIADDGQENALRGYV
jgi:16S rRNA (guanine(966)-N(2))-methyltransferase RsmD